MATTTGTVIIYDSWKKYMATVANLATDTFKIGLTTSSYTPSQSAHETLSDITNEVSGNGYARQTLGSVTWNEASGTVTFDFTDPVFSASGGSITARYFFIYDDTPTSPADPLVCYGLLDDSPADVVTTDGNTLTFNVNASGLYTLSGGGA